MDFGGGVRVSVVNPSPGVAAGTIITATSKLRIVVAQRFQKGSPPWLNISVTVLGALKGTVTGALGATY